MKYTDSSFDTLLKPYFDQMDLEFMSKFQKRIDDHSDATAEKYRSFLKREYRIAMFEHLADFVTEEVTLPDEPELSTQLHTNYETCRRMERIAVEQGSTNWLVSRLDCGTVRTESENRAVAQLLAFMKASQTLALLVALNRIETLPGTFKDCMTQLAEISGAISDEQWKRLTISPFSVSETLDNLRCAYGEAPLWQAPIFRDNDSLRDAGPIDDGTYWGHIRMDFVRWMLGEEKIPLPEGIDWSEVLRENDEALLYGDWRSPMPNDMRQAIEWHQHVSSNDS